MVLDKYFGILKIHDELTVFESFIDHSRIDEEELLLLKEIVQFICNNELDKIETHFEKIKKINTESSKIFEDVSDQIIQSNFDHQKQSDLLRLHQRIDSISGLIRSTAKRTLIFQRIQANLPSELHEPVQTLMDKVLKIHQTYRKVLEQFVDNKKEVIKHIHNVREQEQEIDVVQSDCLEILYRLANKDSIPNGSFMIIHEIIEYLEKIGDAIDSSSTSIDWLLLYS